MTTIDRQDAALVGTPGTLGATRERLAELARLRALPDHDLTLMVEEVGDAWLLLALVGHASPVVREGVAYGMARLVRGDVTVGACRCLAALRQLAAGDPSPGVREAAVEALTP